MGFCLFNNAAVAAAHAREGHGVDRVLIVDWDVHHGNGTQDIFYFDGQVSFLSAHRYPFYPGTGAADETGSGPGLGATVNLPLRFGISRRDYRGVFARALEELADRCRPQLVLISAGFDAHALDPIGSLGLESEDFGDLTRLLLNVAKQHAGGRVVSLLEGGYNLDALAESVACHLTTLLEEPA
jgi:acetoin utilization deacetylase AcuC-like enzyme